MSIRRLVFGIPPAEAMFQRRGFHAASTEARLCLEEIGRIFLLGYHEAVYGASLPLLVERLEKVAPEHRGFAYEGAAMGLELLDALTPWQRRRWSAMSSGPGLPHVYMLHVGAGWAAARIPWRRPRIMASLKRYDPLLAWLVIDGFGFHQGYFHPRAFIEQQRRLQVSHPYFHRAFDQGLGRSLWFSCGADVQRVGATIGRFDETRRGDLWSGVGLACTYAGGVEQEEIQTLPTLARPHAAHLVQGAVFAATARVRAGITTMHTQRACRAIADMHPTEMADLCAEALDRTRHSPENPQFDTQLLPDYEIWRSHIRRLATRQCETLNV